MFGIDLKNSLRAGAWITCTLLAACGSESPTLDQVQEDETIETPAPAESDQAPLLSQSPSNAELCAEPAPTSLNLDELFLQNDPLQLHFFFDDAGRMLRVNQDRIIARSADGMIQEWSLKIENISNVQFDGHNTFFFSGSDRWEGAAVGPYLIAMSIDDSESQLQDIGRSLDAQAGRCLSPTRISFDENAATLYAYCPERIPNSCHRVRHLAQWNEDEWQLISVPTEIKSQTCAHQAFAYTNSTDEAIICLYIDTQLHCHSEDEGWVSIDILADSVHIPRFFYLRGSGRLFAYGRIGDAFLDDVINNCREIREFDGTSFSKKVIVPGVCLDNLLLDKSHDQFYLVDKSCQAFQWTGPEEDPVSIGSIGAAEVYSCPRVIAPDPLEPILYVASFLNPCSALDSSCLQHDDTFGLCIP